MKKRTIYGSVIAFLLLLFAACNMMGPDSERISGYDGKVTVHVRIGGTGIQGRTVRPTDALQDVMAWELRGGKQGETTETLLAQFSGAEGTTVVLDSGTWSFTLEGYKNNNLILHGSLIGQNIILDSPNTLEFTVAPVSEGQGTLNLVVELPAGSGITAARVFQDGTEFDDPVEPVNDRIVVTGTYPVGAYRFNIRLYNNEDLYGVVSEAVYIWANLESAKTYTLAQGNLNRTYLIIYHLWEGETETGYYRLTDAALTFEAPARPGYGFEGWYDNAAFSGGAITEIPAGSVGDKSFYAKWGPQVPYTVTFDADGGSPETPETRTVNSGESLGSSPITDITYSSVSGGTWTLLDDGRRRSPAIGDSSVTKARISFTTYAANASITIQLEVSSESNYDCAFISTLDNDSATSGNGYYNGSKISGTQAATVTIPVPTAGSHFIDIGYQKDSSQYLGSDCAWFMVTSSNSGDSTMPPDPTRNGYGFGGWYTKRNGGGSQFTETTPVTGNITVYARWLPPGSVQIQLRPAPANPPLSNESFSMSEEAQFSAGGGYESYQWYWDGVAIAGADSRDYTLTANSKTKGVYEVSVVVTTGGGERLSARCRVTITTY